MVIDTSKDTGTDRRPLFKMGSAQQVANKLTLASQRFRRLPDFVIIGGQRCGTSSFFQYLKGHPQISLPEVKEIHFFDNNYHRGVNWYRSFFPSMISTAKNRAVGGPKFSGEASPYYLFHPIAPKRLRHLIPSAKLVVLLRNPVDRAYSHYQHIVRLGNETLPFPEALQLEHERINGEAEKLIANTSYRSLAHQHFSYLARGIYVDQLETWRRWFPEEQFLVIPSESFYKYPAETLLRFESFVGLREWVPPNFEIINEGKYASMDARIRTELVDYFRPHNRRLFEHLGVEFDWDK